MYRRAPALRQGGEQSVEDARDDIGEDEMERQGLFDEREPIGAQLGADTVDEGAGVLALG